MIEDAVQMQLAIGKMKVFVNSFGQRTFHLACHAAIPVVLDPELLHLLRINFFFDPPESLPFSSESDILLSPLCTAIGSDLYEMSPVVRDILLRELATTPGYGEQRIREIASLLFQYIQRSSRWKGNVALERGQQLTALNFLDAHSAKLWLEAAQQSVHQDSSNERQWFIAMREELLKIDEVLKARPIIADEEDISISPTGLKLATSIAAHKEPIGRIAWSPDGSKLAAPSVDGTIKVWDVDKGELIKTLQGHTSRAICVTWSPTNNYLATGSDDGTARIWNIESGGLVETIEGSSSPVSLAWNRNGRILALGFNDSTVQLWDKARGALRTYEGLAGPVTSLKWSPNAISLAASSEGDTRVLVWTSKKEQERPQTLIHDSYVLDIDWSPDGSMIAAGCSDHSICLWSATTRKLVKTLKGHTDIVNAVSFSSDSLLIASKSHDGTVRIWRTDTGDSVSVIEKQGMALIVAGLAFSPAKPQLATLSHGDTRINIWQVNTGALYGHTERLVTSTKIVLLGERGVGKTSLARALSSKEFQANIFDESERETTFTTASLVRGVSPSRSTRVYAAPSLTIQDSIKVRCETFIWEVGLSDPLLTKTHLFDANIVLMLFDDWASLMRLDQYWKTISGKKHVIWIGIDKDGGEGITDRRLRAELAKRRKNYVFIELRTGKGFSDLVRLLRRRLRSDLNERTVVRKSASNIGDSTLQALREGIIALKEQRDPPVFFRRISEMRDLLGVRYISTNNRELKQGLRYLQHQGLVQLLREPNNQDIVWLEPMYVNHLLESLISAARSNRRYPGIVREDRLLNLAYADSHLKELDREVIEILLGGTTHFLLQRKICSRSLLDGNRVLLFPSIAANSEIVTKPAVPAKSKVSKTPSFASKSKPLTISAFDKLLDWLSPDRANAGAKYEQIRRRLIRFFASRGADNAEDLADTTIDRVAKRVEQVAGNICGRSSDVLLRTCPARVFGICAKKRISVKLSPVSIETPSLEFDDTESGTIELQHRCLSRCLEILSNYDRELVLQYYSGEGQAKIKLKETDERALPNIPKRT